jgi:hypothetical protein
MFRLNFVRQFTRGNLQGLTHSDSIRFSSEAEALRWVRAVNSKRLDYTVISWNVEAL